MSNETPEYITIKTHRRLSGPWLLFLLLTAALLLAAGLYLVRNSNRRPSAEKAFAKAVETEGTRTLLGYVKDSETGEPIENAYVRVTVNGENQGYVTDSNGAYMIEDLPPGHYTLFAKAYIHHTSVVYGFDVTAGEKAMLEDILLTPAPEEAQADTEEMPWDY